jgi:hypothetical protein
MTHNIMRRQRHIMTYQHALVNYLENYRRSIKVTIDDFIHDITSSRSYYRYLNLEQNIPMDVLLKFTNRYQFDLKELLDYLNDQPNIDYYIARIIRMNRLHRHEFIDAYIKKITPYISESLLDVLHQMMSSDNRMLALEKILDNPDINHLITRYKKGKDTQVILEYFVEKGYTLLNDSNQEDLETITLFLENTRTYSNDRYLDYPTTLFLAQLGKDVAHNITQHVALHVFFCDDVSFQHYVNAMNENFQIDIPSRLKSIIQEAFE